MRNSYGTFCDRLISLSNPKISTINLYKKLFAHLKSSRSTLEFASQPFRSLFVLYSPDFGLIKQTLIRTSRCNKVDTVRLYASYRLNLLLPKGQRSVIFIYLYIKGMTIAGQTARPIWLKMF